jgi:hypothetical protein
MLTGDPFAVNIELDKDSTNRNVEIVNAYLKTKGLRLQFKKIKKIRKPMVKFNMVSIDKNKFSKSLVKFVDKNETFDFDNYYKQLNAVEELKSKVMVKQNMVKFK